MHVDAEAVKALLVTASVCRCFKLKMKFNNAKWQLFFKLTPPNNIYSLNRAYSLGANLKAKKKVYLF